MNLDKDTATIMGKNIALKITSSGNYYNLQYTAEKMSIETVCAVRFDV